MNIKVVQSIITLVRLIWAKVEGLGRPKISPYLIAYWAHRGSEEALKRIPKEDIIAVGMKPNGSTKYRRLRGLHSLESGFTYMIVYIDRSEELEFITVKELKPNSGEL